MLPDKLPDLLKSLSHNRAQPDGRVYVSLSLLAACQIAEQTKYTLKEIELQALEHDIVPERYSRNQTFLSNQDQKKLLTSHVAVIGLGGIGGTVTEILARIGVGRLTLIDGDCFDESNFNRQILSSPANLGSPKAHIATQRVNDINPAVETFPVDAFFSSKNGKELLQDVHLVVDCLDTISDRFVAEAVCQKLSIPMISAAICGTCGQATVIFPGDPGLKKVYGPLQKAPAKSIEACIGALPFTAVYMAAVECAEAVTILLRKSPDLQNKLFLADVRNHTSELIEFR